MGASAGSVLDLGLSAAFAHPWSKCCNQADSNSAISKRVQTREPKIFKPEIHAEFQSLLEDFNGVGGYSIFLKDVISLFDDPCNKPRSADNQWETKQDASSRY